MVKTELSDKEIKFIDETSNDIIVARDAIPVEDISINEEVKIHYDEDVEDLYHKYIVTDINDQEITLKWVKQLEESLITESPVITLDDKDTVNPAEINFKQKISQATEKERAEAAQRVKDAEIQQLKEKYADAVTKLDQSLNSDHTAVDTLEVLFDILVPASGEADSVAGELVRAMMRLLYRDANDGDKFFEGYGITSCASSAEYLFDNGFAEPIQNMLDHAWQLSEDDTKYTDALYNLTDKIIHHIKNNTELMFTPNEEDSRDYSAEYIIENQPKYEFELYGSDDIVTLVEKGVLSSWDLIRFVEGQLEWESDYHGAKVATPWSHDDTTVTVTELTKDGYARLKDAFEHDSAKWWGDLASQYADELEDTDYDDEYSDDTFDKTEI